MRPPKPRRRLRKAPGEDALRAVIDETIGLFHRIAFVAEAIYGEEGRSTARRGILRGLARYGAQTVPALARARGVRRQTLQPVVDALEAEGLVARSANPRHARSPLFEVTERGRGFVARWDDADARTLSRIGRGLSRERLLVAAETLGALRQRFERAGFRDRA